MRFDVIMIAITLAVLVIALMAKAECKDYNSIMDIANEHYISIMKERNCYGGIDDGLIQGFETLPNGTIRVVSFKYNE